MSLGLEGLNIENACYSSFSELAKDWLASRHTATGVVLIFAFAEPGKAGS